MVKRDKTETTTLGKTLKCGASGLWIIVENHVQVALQ
jgi:hypothetical protein